MKELIEEIRSEIKKVCPKHLKITKKKYATKKAISDFEKQSGLTFPKDVAEFWLHCDFEITLGTEIYKKLKCDDGPSFFMMEELEYLVEYWKENPGEDLDEEFKKGPYYGFKGRGYREKVLTEKIIAEGWFPIAIDSYDGALCIDLNPGLNGTHGQLIYRMQIGDGKSGPYDAGFKSFRELLEHHLNLLKNQKIDIEEDIIYPLNPF